MIVCPICKENNEDDKLNCSRCNADLTSLIRLREQYKLHYNRGLALAKNSEFYEAVQSLLLSASLNPNHEQSYIILGKIFAQRADYEAALHYFALAQKIAPNNDNIKTYLDNIKPIQKEHQNLREKKYDKNRKKKWLIILSSSVLILLFSMFVIKNNFFQNSSSASSISMQVKQALARNQETAKINVAVDAMNNSLVLQGTISFEWQRKLAYAIAKTTASEFQIDANQLKIDLTPLSQLIENAIQADSELAKESIRIVQKDSVIQLEGVISNPGLRKHAEKLVHESLGINFYDNSNLIELPANYVYTIRKGDTGYKLAKIFYDNPYQFTRIKEKNILILNDDYNWPVDSIIIIPGPIKIETNLSSKEN